MTDRRWETPEQVIARLQRELAAERSAALAQLASLSADLSALGTWVDWDEADANLNIGSTGVKIARYMLLGDTVWWDWQVTLGGSGISVGAVEITLPFTPAARYVENVSIMGQGILLDDGTATYHAAARLDASGTQAAIRTFTTGASDSQTRGLSSTVPHSWAAGDVMSLAGRFERAPV